MRIALVAVALVAVVTGGALVSGIQAQGSGAAWFLRSLDMPADRREARPDVLDTPVLPGSIIKTVALAAALESHVIEPDTARICRRTVTVDGRRYVCAHPDIKRPLTPAEALAHSCNDFFVSLAPRLTRAVLNDMRARVGLAAVPSNANLAAAIVGLDGPRITPRAMLDAVTRLAGFDRDRPVALRETTRRVLLDGMRGAADYGTAAALHARGVDALAKTGTAPMPGGSWMGMVVALTPPDNPARALVVVAPGGAGVDAASIAADLLSRGEPSGSPAPRPAPSRGEPSGSPHLTLRIGVTDRNGRVRPTDLGLEDYIAQVLAGEGQPAAAAGAQEALAITARTFALANRNRHRREGYDLCDTTHCQVMRPATAATRRAAEATAGRVLVHEGQPALVFYSAWCGGQTELASEVWPGALNYAFEPSQHDEACGDEPGWSSDLSVEEVERALRAAGLRGDRVRGLRIVDRNASGRVMRLRVDGFTPPEVSGHDFRMAVGRVAGWSRLKSTMFDLQRTGSGYRFAGRGFGHGVGLCVIGAGRRAANGASAEEILRFYFPGLRVDTFRDGRRLTGAPAPASGPPAAPAKPAEVAKPAAARDDVQIALPAGDESERARMVQAIRSARDEIAKRTATTPPSTIRVTVHPTVESFGRATGQPWWVSGATGGAEIDLVPLTILRQRGILDRAIRHEVAHVLLDATLAGRRLWVREGAALYFAGPLSDDEPSSRTECPADAEFLRPMSAGAHRSAYARAEACFRRAVAGGRRWSDVR